MIEEDDRNSRERTLVALSHREPDRVPFDLGGTVDTGIHYIAYRNLLLHLNKSHLLKDLGEDETKLLDPIQGIVSIDEEVARYLRTDVRAFRPNDPSSWDLTVLKAGHNKAIIDELGVKWTKRNGEHYFDQTSEGHPLSALVDLEDIERYPWPDAGDPARTAAGLRESIEKHSKDYAITLGDPFGGILATGFRMRGYANFYMDLAAKPSLACSLMDKITELKMEYWRLALDKVGDLINVIVLEDDLGQQDRTLVSPKMYRKLIKPRYRRLINLLKERKSPWTYIFFHTDGSVYNVLPDLIEMGIDILNPVQVSAAKMDPAKLKKEFGNEITFWGGGVDTQQVLPFAKPEEVKQEVRKRIEELAPGGGFVFSTIHNIQPDVPPENLIAMWEALQEYGKY